MEAYASVEDVKQRWIATALPPEDSIIKLYLQDATTLIDSDPLIRPPVAERIQTESGLAERARLVCARMVIRCLVNPDRIRVSQENQGDFGGSITYAAETLGDLALTPEDRDLLRPKRSGAGGPFSRGPSLETPPAHILYPSQVINRAASEGEES